MSKTTSHRYGVMLLGATSVSLNVLDYGDGTGFIELASAQAPGLVTRVDGARKYGSQEVTWEVSWPSLGATRPTEAMLYAQLITQAATFASLLSSGALALSAIGTELGA